MSVITIFFIGFSLAMDAFAVSISNGLILKNVNNKIAFKFGGIFSLFQFGMTVIGYLIAKIFSSYIIALDHWIAFILLNLIGFKMIYETFGEDDKDTLDKENILSFKNLLILAIATSIDALAVGVSFAFILSNIFTPAIIIGLITFILCFFGVYIGSKLGKLFKKSAERVGGIILIIIGFKILIEHIS